MAQKISSELAHLRSHKFYVGSRKIVTVHRSWPKKTLQQAITHAEQLVAETGEDQFVVQVVRIVRRKPTPTVVEKL